MRLHLARGFSLAAALAFLAAPSVTFADPLPIAGTTSGVWTNPSPTGGGIVTTGVNSSVFTWGQGSNSQPNKLTYAADSPFSTTTETQFKLGTITYFNGTTTNGSTPDYVDLKISLDLTTPNQGPLPDSQFTFRLYSTTNTNNPDASADFVYFPSSFSSTTFSVDNVTYTLKLLGFDNVVGDGFLNSTSSELHVREQGTATADLMAMVTAELPPAVPEPASIAIVAVAGAFGLAHAARRRRNASRG